MSPKPSSEPSSFQGTGAAQPLGSQAAPRQGARLRILFICAMNQKRSLTAEHLYRNDRCLEVRSAGVRAEAKRRVSEADLRWADMVFVMEREHKRRLADQFKGQELPPIEVLDIPDDFEYMDVPLQEILRLTLDPEIEALIAKMEAQA